MNKPTKMFQEAPFPYELADLVENIKYKPEWIFKLVDRDRGQESIGLTLVVTTLTHESIYNDDNDDTSFERWPLTRVNHFFIVPSASFNRSSWQRWLLDRVIEIETHEACEFFRINGERVYAPHHGEGEDPYTIWQVGTPEDAKKTFRDK